MRLKPLVMRPVIKKAPEHPAKVKAGLPTIDPSCVLYLKMNELSGTLIDQSGNGNHGTVIGASYGQAGKFGHAMGFDGVDDYIDAGNVGNFTSENFTVSFWIKIHSYNGNANDPVIIFKGEFNVNGWFIQSQITSGAFLKFVTNQGGVAQVTSVDAEYLTLDVWKHVTVTRNGSVAKIYVDAVDRTNTSGAHINPAPSSSNLQIGKYSTLTFFIDGFIDEVRIYNRAFSAVQVEAMYLEYLAYDTYKEV